MMRGGGVAGASAETALHLGCMHIRDLARAGVVQKPTRCLFLANQQVPFFEAGGNAFSCYSKL